MTTHRHTASPSRPVLAVRPRVRRAGPALLIALGTLACVDHGVRPGVADILPDSADQVLFGMETTLTDRGVRRQVLNADTAYLYQASERYTLRGMSVTFYDTAGSPTSTLTARRGILDMRQSSLDARGAVRWVTPGRRQVLETEHLIYDRQARMITGDTAFTYRSPGDILTGRSFVTDEDLKSVRVQQPRAVQTAPPKASP